MNGNISKEGITLDLEAMHRMGIAGALCFNNGVGIPRGPVDYASPEWFSVTEHAMKEAQRLGLQLMLHNSPGYSGTGGPWITPEMSMQQLSWSEVLVKNSRKINILLPQPYAKRFHDFAVDQARYLCPRGTKYVVSCAGRRDDLWKRSCSLFGLLFGPNGGCALRLFAGGALFGSEPSGIVFRILQNLTIFANNQKLLICKAAIMDARREHSVMVELFDNTFTDKKDDRYGRVVTTASITEDDLVAEVVAQRTDFNAVTLRAAFDLMTEAAAKRIANGASVRFGLAHIQLGVNGLFIGDQAKWDADRHTLSVQMIPTADLRRVVKTVKVDVRGLASSGMAVNTVTDSTTGEVNGRITPGGGAVLRGQRIKIVGEHPQTGITLTHSDTRQKVDISPSALLVNSPSNLTFIVPVALAAGDYTLTLCSQYSPSNRLMKSPRTYTFGFVLSVL